MRTTLNELKSGSEANIIEVNASGAVRQRLLDMGLLPQVTITKQREALGGDPIWIKVDNIQLALRKGEATSIIVEAQ